MQVYVHLHVLVVLGRHQDLLQRCKVVERDRVRGEAGVEQIAHAERVARERNVPGEKQNSSTKTRETRIRVRATRRARSDTPAEQTRQARH